MAISRLKITDVDGNEFIFPPDFWIKDDPFKVNKNTINFFYAAGGKDISDGYPLPRVITIGGAIREDTKASYETLYRQIMFALMKGGALEKTIDEVARYINIKSPTMTMNPEEYQQYKEVEITFNADYPFWQDSTETTDLQVMAGDGTFYVDNTGSDFLVFPVIQIEADQSVDVPSVKMTNLSDGGMTFEYNNPAFVQGDVLEIDCYNGSVTLNNNNSIEFFNPARFFRLQPSNNEIEFEGAACTISFIFRKVYI